MEEGCRGNEGKSTQDKTTQKKRRREAGEKQTQANRRRNSSQAEEGRKKVKQFGQQKECKGTEKGRHGKWALGEGACGTNILEA